MDSNDREFLSRLASTHTLVAHNAPFDAAVWEHAEKLPEAKWFDTLVCARAAGFPGALDALGNILEGRGKDKNGKRLIDMLCCLRKGQQPPVVGPAHAMLMQYNVRDVELLETVYSRVKSNVEPAVMTVDRVINDRGVPADRGYLEGLRELFVINKAAAAEEFDSRTDGVVPGSHKQVKEWMRSLGFKVPVINEKETVSKVALKQLQEDPEGFFVGEESEFGDALETLLEVFNYRAELTGVGQGKADAALEVLEEDGRMRDQFAYYGAGPGRWAGRRLQLQNMPKMVPGIDVRGLPLDYAAVAAAAREASERNHRHVTVGEVLNAMLRHMVVGDSFLVADYAAIEARLVAWLADERRMLELYSDPEKSVYIDMGRTVFGRTLSKKNDPDEYTIAKTLVLGCGYGMSGAKFEAKLKLDGISTEPFERAGLNPRDAVKMYRDTYPAIPAMWKALGCTVLECVKHRASLRCARCEFHMVGDDMHIVLPSGRPIVYRNARVDYKVPSYCKLYGMPPTPVETVVYDSPRGYLGFLYGSKTAENITQGTARDLLANTLVNTEQLSMRPFLHVHDEAACEAEDRRLEEFLCCMSDVPKWGVGAPVLVEGYSGPVWTKQTKGYRELAALNGRIVCT